MTTSLSGRLRRLWLDVHLWIGVGLLVALIPLGISGSLLVWHEPLDQLLHPHRFAVSQATAELPPSRYLAAARAAFGDRATVTQLRLPDEEGGPVIASGRVNGQPAPGARPATLTAWIDPGTARVLDVAQPRNEFLGVMHRLHGSLMIPGVGRKVVGWLGWAMTVSCLTGLWLWWPRNGAVLKALRWRRSPSTLDNLHHMFGFWILMPLLAVSLTGVYISFPQTSRGLFGIETSGPRGPGGPGGRGGSPLAAPKLDIDAAGAAATSTIRGARLLSIALPSAGERPSWRVQLQAPGADKPVTVQIDDASGRVRQARTRPGQGGDTLSPLMRKLHDGGGTWPLWQVLVFLSGLAPPLLGGTGIVMWLRRRARRRALARP
ncbi:MAG: PepSY domain-containing protein [Caulobacter sp.]|nr:PepSY domain-containing protein [Caulobacter sp.]